MFSLQTRSRNFIEPYRLYYLKYTLVWFLSFPWHSFNGWIKMMLWLAGFQIQFDSYRTAWRNCPEPLTDLVRLLHLSTQGTDQNTLLLIKKNLNAEKQKPKDLYTNTSGGRNPYHFEILIFINNFQNQYKEITTSNVQCCTFQPHLIIYICKQKTLPLGTFRLTF